MEAAELALPLWRALLLESLDSEPPATPVEGAPQIDALLCGTMLVRAAAPDTAPGPPQDPASHREHFHHLSVALDDPLHRTVLHTMFPL